MRGKQLSLHALGLAVVLAATMAPSITEASHGGSGHGVRVGAVAIAQIPITPSSRPATHNGFAPVVHAPPVFHTRPVFRHRRFFGGDSVGFFVPYVIEPHIITVTSGSGTSATGNAGQSRPVIERFAPSRQPKGSILLVRGTSVSFVVF